MPPHRRRPAPTSGQAPPIRRPKVAGLRNRPGHPAEDQGEQQETRQPEETDTTGAQDRESVSGVLNGVLGEPPATRDEPTPAEDADDQDDTAERTTGTLDTAASADTAETTDSAGTAETAETTDGTADETAEAEPEPEVTAVTRSTARPRADGDRRPAGKRRATGTARPSDLAEAETSERTGGTGDTGEPIGRYVRAAAPARSKASRQISVAIVLAVVAVVLAGLAVFFRGKVNDLTSGDTNTALTDSAATSQVKGQLTTAIKQTFSYNYTDLDATEKAVRENLTGKALCEYNLLFGEVKEYAPAQKIVLDTTVRELAVVRIDGDRAEALVYIDQLSTRVDVNKTVAVRGQFAVRAHRDADHWKITEFDMFGQPLFNGKPPPKC